MPASSFRCLDCDAVYPADSPRWRCGCGAPLEVDVETIFPKEALASRRANMWRYREAIPIQEDAHIVSMDEGMTPLSAVSFAGHEIHCKLDCLFPTGSFKDRMEVSAWPTIPQVFIGGEFVGGCDIVLEMLRSGELQEKVGALPA